MTKFLVEWSHVLPVATVNPDGRRWVSERAVVTLRYISDTTDCNLLLCFDCMLVVIDNQGEGTQGLSGTTHAS